MDEPTKRTTTTTQLACIGLLAMGVLGAAWRAGKEVAIGDVAWELPVTLAPPSGFDLPTAIEALPVSGDQVPSVHAVSAIATPDGGLRAYWFGGSREGASDVGIWTAALPPNGTSWSGQQVAIDRPTTEDELNRHIRKLGNPVAFARGNVVDLFYVSVSAGGWSGSAINAARSEDGGIHFGTPERLVTSPVANISTLVKAPPIAYQDGSIGLPVYHEMVAKFPQLIRIQPDTGEVVGRQTFAGGPETIQPWIVVLDATRAVALLRRIEPDEPSVHISRTDDGGKTWSAPSPIGLPNPNASVAALHLGGNSILMAYNHSEEKRNDLSLARSDDGGLSWNRLGAVETNKRHPDESDKVDFPKLEYSYPWLVPDQRGGIHLLYTWNRKQIRHLRIPAQP